MADVVSRISSVSVDSENFDMNLITLDGNTLTTFLKLDSANSRVNSKVAVDIDVIAAATTDTDKFLVSDGGVVKYRTGAELLSDIGGAGSGSISGTTNTIAKFTSSTGVGNSNITDTGILVSVASAAKLNIDNVTDAATTTDGSLQTDGGLSVVKDAVIGDDLSLLSDAAVLNFGADKDVTLTHVHNVGLSLNTALSIAGSLTVSGGVFKNVTTVTNTYTILATDYTVVCNKATAFTVTLPAAVVGQIFNIVNIGVGAVTVDGAGSDTINGEITQILNTDDCMTIQCIAANIWRII